MDFDEKGQEEITGCCGRFGVVLQGVHRAGVDTVTSVGDDVRASVGVTLPASGVGGAPNRL